MQTPWSDVNCNNATAPICGGFGARTTNRNELVFHAQVNWTTTDALVQPAACLYSAP